MRETLVAVYTVAALAAVIPGVTAWMRRAQAPLRGPVAVIFLGVFEWAGFQALSAVAPTPEAKLWLNYFIFPGVCVVVVGFYWHTLVFSGHRAALSRRGTKLLMIAPVLTTLAAFTDPWHHLFYERTEIGQFGTLVTFPGPLYWIHATYSYLLLTVGAVLVFRAMVRALAGHRRSFVMHFICGQVPLVGNIATVAVASAQGVDLTPMAFLVTAGAWWWMGSRGDQAYVVPIAYKRVLASLPDAVMVIDAEDRFLDLNPAAERLLDGLRRRRGPEKMVGAPWQEVLGPEAARFTTDQRQHTVTTRAGAIYDVQITPLIAERRSDRRRELGRVVVARDITEVERLRAYLTEQAIRDGLTGVYNRRHLTEILDAEVPRAAVNGAPFSVVMLDIDHFKRINDHYGHAGGDKLLVRFAQELLADSYEGETIARYGGEEFVAVLPHCDARTAAARAEYWRQCCAQIMLDTEQGPLTGMTFSAGVAQVGYGSTPDTLLHAADEALYLAKARGRDQVVVAGLEDTVGVA